MTAPAPATWTVVPMRWRLVRAGDVVLDPDGNPWMVRRRWPLTAELWVEIERGTDRIGSNRDPDQTVRVLVPADMAASVAVAREALGPVRVLDRA